MRQPKLNLNPTVVGYWARVHGFTYSQLLCCGDPDLEAATAADPGAFDAGWHEADRELHAEQLREKLAALRDSLAGAYEGQD